MSFWRRDKKKNPTSELHELWAIKQRAAYPGSYYGDGGTIHGTTHIDVSTKNGVVTAVWFRCKQLPFKQWDNGEHAVPTAQGNPENIRLTGVEING